jgi:DNA-binding response OmpR family regulator
LVDLNVTISEFRLFQWLTLHKGEFITREGLVKVLSDKGKILPRTIDQHIYTLRKKIKNSKCVIKSKRGQGYCLYSSPRSKLSA